LRHARTAVLRPGHRAAASVRIKAAATVASKGHREGRHCKPPRRNPERKAQTRTPAKRTTMAPVVCKAVRDRRGKEKIIRVKGIRVFADF
jgi:hypothetical protein